MVRLAVMPRVVGVRCCSCAIRCGASSRPIGRLPAPVRFVGVVTRGRDVPPELAAFWCRRCKVFNCFALPGDVSAPIPAAETG